MKTIALRFGDHFAPQCGTIKAHEELISKNGFVWFGKLGTKVSPGLLKEILSNDDPTFLLIASGKIGRYWAHFSDVKFDAPPLNEFPSYYADKIPVIKTWFKITKFETAPKDVMSKCIVISSGEQLGMVSKHSMSPYFKIKTKEDV